MKDKNAVLVSLVVERNGDGYLASVPSIQGAFAEGDTIEEAIFNCADVLEMISVYRRERG
jgi:predicted RNase H-like HicB family nuclease